MLGRCRCTLWSKDEKHTAAKPTFTAVVLLPELACMWLQIYTVSNVAAITQCARGTCRLAYGLVAAYALKRHHTGQHFMPATLV